MVYINDLSPAFSSRIDRLREFVRQPTLYKPFLEQALDGLQAPYENISDLLNILLEGQRLLYLHEARLEENSSFHEFYQSSELHSWYQIKSPPVEPELIQNLAKKLYNVRPSEPDYALVQISEGTRALSERIVECLIQDQKSFDLIFKEPVFMAELLNQASEQGIRQLAGAQLQQWDPVNRRIAINSGMPSYELPEISPDKEQLYQDLLDPVGRAIRSGKIHFTLTSIPTRKDAEIDGIAYEDYLALFFEMCDQPWEAIGEAQSLLIQKLNAGEELHFTNEDGTDLTMSVKGMSFANSLISRNIPGSEVFSAPVKDSVEGTVVAKGHFLPPGRRTELIQDIELTFKNGKIVNYSASQGQEHLQKLIETDEGSCHLGEIGIGTNPHLKQRVANILLVEKISGSFHIALGAPYTMKEYMGVPVMVDNGNRSLIHWDITTLLEGKNGQIRLDGEPLMLAGQFLDPALEVLNKGWQVIPRDERPEYWKDYDFYNHSQKQN